MENPEALGFHQETTKESRQQTEMMENLAKTSELVLYKTLHYFITKLCFIHLCGSKNVISTKPYFKSRKLLQISVTKFKSIDIILMCLEILLYKHNAVIKVPGIVKQTVNRK